VVTGHNEWSVEEIDDAAQVLDIGALDHERAP
jgi:hypothetical protein